MKAWLLILVIFWALAGCQHASIAPRSVSFERINTGMAMGPAYVVTLFSDGRAELRYTASSRIVEKNALGSVRVVTPDASPIRGKIDAEKTASIFTKLDGIGFWDLLPSYRSKEIVTVRETTAGQVGAVVHSGEYVTDLPTQIVTALRAGVSKRVEDYYGTPEGVKELESLIDQTVTFQLEPRLKRWLSN